MRVWSGANNGKGSRPRPGWEPKEQAAPAGCHLRYFPEVGDWLKQTGSEGVIHKGATIAEMEGGVEPNGLKPYCFLLHSYSSTGREVDVLLGECDCPNLGAPVCSHLYAVCAAYPAFRLTCCMLAACRDGATRLGVHNPDEVWRHMQRCLPKGVPVRQQAEAAMWALSGLYCRFLEAAKKKVTCTSCRKQVPGRAHWRQGIPPPGDWEREEASKLERLWTALAAAQRGSSQSTKRPPLQRFQLLVEALSTDDLDATSVLFARGVQLWRDTACETLGQNKIPEQQRLLEAVNSWLAGGALQAAAAATQVDAGTLLQTLEAAIEETCGAKEGETSGPMFFGRCAGVEAVVCRLLGLKEFASLWDDGGHSEHYDAASSVAGASSPFLQFLACLELQGEAGTAYPLLSRLCEVKDAAISKSSSKGQGDEASEQPGKQRLLVSSLLEEEFLDLARGCAGLGSTPTPNEPNSEAAAAMAWAAAHHFGLPAAALAEAAAEALSATGAAGRSRPRLPRAAALAAHVPRLLPILAVSAQKNGNTNSSSTNNSSSNSNNNDNNHSNDNSNNHSNNSNNNNWDLGPEDADRAISAAPWLEDLGARLQWASCFERRCGGDFVAFVSSRSWPFALLGLQPGQVCKVPRLPLGEAGLEEIRVAAVAGDGPQLAAMLAAACVAYGGCEGLPLSSMERLVPHVSAQLLASTLRTLPKAFAAHPALLRWLCSGALHSEADAVSALGYACPQGRSALHAAGLRLGVQVWRDDFEGTLEGRVALPPRDLEVAEGPGRTAMQEQRRLDGQALPQERTASKDARVEGISPPTTSGQTTDPTAVLAAPSSEDAGGSGAPPATSDLCTPGEAHALVASIRLEEFGMGPTQELEQETMARWGDAERKQALRLSRALKSLSGDIYSGDLHLLHELLQNADDNRYAAGVLPEMQLLLSKDGFCLLNNELGFTARDLRALCDVGSSSKAGDAGRTGEKGLGFKSVFRICDRPRIFSGPLQVGFDSRHPLLPYILPIPLGEAEELDLPEEALSGRRQGLWRTVLHLPLRPGLRGTPEAAELLCRIAATTPDTLLFLRRLRRVHLKPGGFLGKDHEWRRGGKDEQRPTEELLVALHGPAGIQRWLCVSREVAVPPLLQSTRRDGGAPVRSTIVTVAVPVVLALALSTGTASSSSSEAVGCDSTPPPRLVLDASRPCPPVFASLPVRPSGLRFAINADWRLTTSREDLAEGAWNEFIRAEVPKLYLQDVQPLLCDASRFAVEEPGHLAGLLGLTPCPSGSAEAGGFLRPLAMQLLDALQHAPCVPALASNNSSCMAADSSELQVRWVQPAEAAVPPSGKLGREALQLHSVLEASGCALLHPDVAAATPQAALDALGVRRLACSHLLVALRRAAVSSSQTFMEGFLQLGQRRQMLALLVSLFEGEDLSSEVASVSELKALPLVPISGLAGAAQVLAEAGSVCLPPTGGSLPPALLQCARLPVPELLGQGSGQEGDAAEQGARVHRLLVRLGATELTPAVAARKLLPQFNRRVLDGIAAAAGGGPAAESKQASLRESCREVLEWLRAQPEALAAVRSSNLELLVPVCGGSVISVIPGHAALHLLDALPEAPPAGLQEFCVRLGVPLQVPDFGASHGSLWLSSLALGLPLPELALQVLHAAHVAAIPCSPPELVWLMRRCSELPLSELNSLRDLRFLPSFCGGSAVAPCDAFWQDTPGGALAKWGLSELGVTGPGIRQVLESLGLAPRPTLRHYARALAQQNLDATETADLVASIASLSLPKAEVQEALRDAAIFETSSGALAAPADGVLDLHGAQEELLLGRSCGVQILARSPPTSSASLGLAWRRVALAAGVVPWREAYHPTAACRTSSSSSASGVPEPAEAALDLSLQELLPLVQRHLLRGSAAAVSAGKLPLCRPPRARCVADLRLVLRLRTDFAQHLPGQVQWPRELPGAAAQALVEVTEDELLLVADLSLATSSFAAGGSKSLPPAAASAWAVGLAEELLRSHLLSEEDSDEVLLQSESRSLEQFLLAASGLASAGVRGEDAARVLGLPTLPLDVLPWGKQAGLRSRLGGGASALPGMAQAAGSEEDGESLFGGLQGGLLAPPFSQLDEVSYTKLTGKVPESAPAVGGFEGTDADRAARGALGRQANGSKGAGRGGGVTSLGLGDPKEKFQRLFAAFDQDGDGILQQSEVAALNRATGGGELSDEDYQQICSMLGVGSGEAGVGSEALRGLLDEDAVDRAHDQVFGPSGGPGGPGGGTLVPQEGSPEAESGGRAWVAVSAAEVHESRARAQLEELPPVATGGAETEERLRVGRWGEELVLEHMRLKLEGTGKRVRWLNDNEESGEPYDLVVESCSDGEILEYIEVKTTRSLDKAWFEVSGVEWAFCRYAGEKYNIYRVLGAGMPSASIRVARNPAALWRDSGLGLAMAL